MSEQEQADCAAAIYEGSAICAILDLHERFPDKLVATLNAALNQIGYSVHHDRA